MIINNWNHWNNAYRRIFRINAWESVTGLQFFYGKSNLKTIIERTRNFFNNLCAVLQCFDAVGWVAGRASGL